MEGRLAAGRETAARHEGLGAQEVALAAVPLEAVAAGAQRRSEAEGALGYSDALVRELLAWFKRDFFTWADGAWCADCGLEAKAQPLGGRAPSAEERRHLAARVEAFRCEACGRECRFPRYNCPIQLLRTRRGRCGEFANCFCLILRALGHEARWCLDFTDHVWCEFWSGDQGRWVHLDPCEDCWDEPHLYEKGWGKKLTYVLGFSRLGVQDVTRRYTERWGEVQGRRALCSEAALAEALRASTAAIRRTHEPATAALWDGRDAEERAALLAPPPRPEAAATASEELMPGRQSGSVEWRAARKELGGEKREGADGGKSGKEGGEGAREGGGEGGGAGARAEPTGETSQQQRLQDTQEAFKRLLQDEFKRLTVDPEMQKDPNKAAALALQNVQKQIQKEKKDF